MREFIIDPEFRDKIPPLSADEFQRLEENIVADGEVREPLVVWNNTIIDGHNRWKIIQKYPGLHYEVKQMSFPDKWAAIVWMCKNQLGRRNLSEEQRAYIIKEQYEAHAKSIGGNGSNQYVKVQSEENHRIAKANQDSKNKTRSEIAESNNMSLYQVQAAVEFGRGLDAAEKASPGIKNAVLSGETKAPKSLIAKIRNTPEEKRPAAVEAIKSGDIDAAKKIINDSKPQPPKKEEPEQEPFSAKELGELINAAAKALDFSLKQHLVLVHRDLLDTKEGREESVKALNGVVAVAQKYLDMVREAERIGEEN